MNRLRERMGLVAKEQESLIKISVMSGSLQRRQYGSGSHPETQTSSQRHPEFIPQTGRQASIRAPLLARLRLQAINLFAHQAVERLTWLFDCVPPTHPATELNGRRISFYRVYGVVVRSCIRLSQYSWTALCCTGIFAESAVVRRVQLAISKLVKADPWAASLSAVPAAS